MSVADLVASSIALLALGFTAWQAASTRKHNRLSVRPRIMLEIDLHWAEGYVAVVMHNVGLGPGLINSLSITVGNETYVFGRSKNTQKDLANVANEISSDAISHTKTKITISTYEKSSGTAMLAGTSTTLLKFESSNDNIGALKEYLSKCHFLIRYESMYNESFTFDSDINK